MRRWLQRFAGFRRDLIAEARLAETLDRLVADGELTSNTAARLKQTLAETRHESQYILGHLGAHLAIGGIFLFDVIPLPLGTLCRGAWVAGSRVYETIQQNPSRSAVHSVPVFVVALIPFVGYFAYLIPLRQTNVDAAYIYANHVTYLRKNCSLEESLRRKPRWLERLLRGALASVMEKPREE